MWERKRGKLILLVLELIEERSIFQSVRSLVFYILASRVTVGWVQVRDGEGFGSRKGEEDRG
jgi:hypothetical protein